MPGAVDVRSLLAAAAWIGVGCSLTGSLDDLKANAGSDAGSDVVLDAPGDVGAKGGSGGSDSGSGGSGGAGGKDAGLDGPPADGSGGSDATNPCKDRVDCQQCCVNNHAQGAKDYLDAIQVCVCGDASACAVPCSAYCVGGTLDSVCSACVSSQAVQSCLAQNCSAADCKAYTSCVAVCT